MSKDTKDALKQGRELLKKHEIDIKEARLLLAYAMGIDINELIKYDYCSDMEFENYIGYIKRRCDGEPYAYIVGHKEFMKLDFMVNKSVLIPRNDTEILVLEAIKLAKTKILDMCTGSGCIAISLAKYLDFAEVDAADISSRALSVAKKNAVNNDVKVNFIKSDLFENIDKKYDMIISNPPYIKKSDMANLQKEVKREPKLALEAGEDGLYFYEKIITSAKDYLAVHGMLLLEIGYDEAKDVTKMLKENNYKKIKKIKDLGGNDRVLIAER